MCNPEMVREIFYDRDLEIEAYHLGGIVQKFPNHFHECFVIGYVECGTRRLWCKGQEYEVNAGDLLLFNPRENHCCEPIGEEPLEYRAINIRSDKLRQAASEVMGKNTPPYFTQNVIRQCDITQSLTALYAAICTCAPRLKKEEAYFFLMEQLLSEYAAPEREIERPEPDQQVKKLCRYMEAHFEENISLDHLAEMTTFGKSYLLRVFTRQVGLSPYRYLQAVRLERVKEFLEQGIPPVEAANMAGFADQSHFTNFFREFIGLTPKQYQKIFISTAVSTEEEQKSGKKT